MSTFVLLAAKWETRPWYSPSQYPKLLPVSSVTHDIRVPTSSGNHGKPGKSLKKFHAWKILGIGKNVNNHGKIMEFCEII